MNVHMSLMQVCIMSAGDHVYYVHEHAYYVYMPMVGVSAMQHGWYQL